METVIAILKSKNIGSVSKLWNTYDSIPVVGGKSTLCQEDKIKEKN